jgi:hypothetical protein
MGETRIISILGELWKINYNVKIDDDDVDAQTHPYERVINIADDIADGADVKRIIRHEIIHAFMFESGLGFNFEHKPFGQDETMIDWFAVQYPKMKIVFRLLDIEG